MSMDNLEFIGTFDENDRRLKKYISNPAVYRCVKSISSGSNTIYNVYKYKR